MRQKIISFEVDSYDNMNPSDPFLMTQFHSKLNYPGWLSNDPLPAIVESALADLQQKLETTETYGYFDDMGHNNIGFANFLRNVKEINYPEDNYSIENSTERFKQLVIRISFGPEGSRKKTTIWDRTTFNITSLRCLWLTNIVAFKK